MGISSLTDMAAAIDRTAPLLLDTAARSVAVLLLAAMAALILRRASAATRHWVWLLGFTGLVLLPVLVVFLPGWRILPRMESNRAVPVTTVQPSSFLAPIPVARQVESQDPPIVLSSPAVIPQNSTVAAAPSQGGGRTPAVATAGWFSQLRLEALPWSFWVALAWLVGAGLLVGHMLLGYVSLWLLQRRCEPTESGDWPKLLEQLRRELGVRNEVQLLSSPLRTMPMTWGVWRTRLLLPEQSTTWPLEQRRSVLLHELGHIRRRDCLTQLFAQTVRAVYWFNPLVWIAWNRMQVERERACDDLVINSGARASSYAEHLLHSASAMPTLRFIGAAALAMARASTLEERLRAILDAKRNRRAMTVSGALIAALLLTAALVPVATLKAQENPAAPATPTPSVEERMRVRRAEDPVPAVDATSSATTRPASPVGGAGGRASSVRGGGFGGGAGRGGFGGAAPITDAGGRGARPMPTPGEGPTCSFDATIYDVRLPGSQIGRIDMDALNKAAATTDTFEKALASLGTTRPLYRANQSVRLAHDSIIIGTTQPYVTNSQITAQGNTINTVAYSSVGALFELAGKTTGGAGMEIDLSIEVSTLSEGDTPIANNVKAPVFHRVNMSRRGPIESNQAFVIMSIDAASVDPDGKAVAYITRVTMGTPQPQSP